MGDFRDLGVQIGSLVAEKQEAYGDSFGQSGKVLEVLFPDGVKVSQYPTFLSVTRVIDKLFRVANKKDAFGESPWRDIAGYALLGINADETGRENGRPTSFDIEQHILDFARKYGIPTQVPEDDETLDHPCPICPQMDEQGLRVILNSDRSQDGCCAHPERGICCPEPQVGHDLAPSECDPTDSEQPKYEFVIDGRNTR